MFRPLRRKKRAITDEAARELLATCKRGVFAVNGDDGYPYAIPVNYFFDAEHDKIYFHGAKAGHKVDALKRDDKVCFTVYGNDWYKDDDWAPYVQSTVVFGRCRLANDTPAFIENKVRELALKYYPTAEEVEEEIAKDIKGVQLYEITIEHLCGKQIQEKYGPGSRTSQLTIWPGPNQHWSRAISLTRVGGDVGKRLNELL